MKTNQIAFNEPSRGSPRSALEGVGIFIVIFARPSHVSDGSWLYVSPKIVICSEGEADLLKRFIAVTGRLQGNNFVIKWLLIAAVKVNSI